MLHNGDTKLIIDIPEDLYIRIQRAKSVPDLTGTDIINAVMCINRGIEITAAIYAPAQAESAIQSLLDRVKEEVCNNER